MPTRRARRFQRFRVWIVDRDDPIEVQTNGVDWAAVTTNPNNPSATDMTFQACHRALVRCGHDVPANYLVFLDKALDGMPELIDGDPELLDPTRTGP